MEITWLRDSNGYLASINFTPVCTWSGVSCHSLYDYSLAFDFENIFSDVHSCNEYLCQVLKFLLST